MIFDEKMKKIALEAKEEMDRATCKFDSEFSKYLKTVKPFDFKDPILWKFVAALSKNLKDSRVDHACHNTFCYWKKDDIISAVRAVVTIGEIKSALYEKLYDVITGKSDDSYGDFIDSFFLAGPIIVNNALEGKYGEGDESKLRNEVLNSCGNTIFSRIWDGENYFKSTLEDEVKTWLEYVNNPRTEEKQEPKENVGYWFETV